MIRINLIINQRDNESSHLIESSNVEGLKRQIYNYMVMALNADFTSSFRFEPLDVDKVDSILESLKDNNSNDL